MVKKQIIQKTLQFKTKNKKKETKYQYYYHKILKIQKPNSQYNCLGPLNNIIFDKNS